MLAASLRYRGVEAASVSGQTGRQERRDVIKRFRAGDIRVLANCDLLAQGFDAPGVRALYIARPTFSPSAYIQMAGRGLRGKENGGKEECLIVDVADNWGAMNDFLGYQDYKELWKEQRRMILVPALADIERRAESNAERTFARLLKNVEGDPDAVAFYSVRLREHAYKQQAEADFVILWKRTVVVVEVKGGGVRKHDGAWYSVDRHNDWHKLATSPMEQAQSAAYALRDILRDGQSRLVPLRGMRCHTGHRLHLPADIAWKRTHWLAHPDMSSARHRRGAGRDRRHPRHRAPPKQRVARIEDLRTRLFGEFTRMPVIDAQRGAVIEEQNRATDGAGTRAGDALAQRPDARRRRRRHRQVPRPGRGRQSRSVNGAGPFSSRSGPRTSPSFFERIRRGHRDRRHCRSISWIRRSATTSSSSTKRRT